MCLFFHIYFSSSHFTIHISLYVDIFRRKRMKEKKMEKQQKSSKRFSQVFLSHFNFFFADFFSFCFYEFCFRCFLCNIFLLLMLFEATILFLMLLLLWSERLLGGFCWGGGGTKVFCYNLCLINNSQEPGYDLNETTLSFLQNFGLFHCKKISQGLLKKSFFIQEGGKKAASININTFL